VELAEFNAADAATAAAELRPACAATAWLAALVDARPFHTVDAVSACSDSVIRQMPWPAIEEALAAHPRIGERAAGSSREAAWSRQEQAGSAASGREIADALRAGNIAYEQRFGHVFLIRATGRSADEMLIALQARLGNDPDRERDVVREELAAIVRLRLAKILD
jgi:2-oxo-4-hydroxy-4-carboxy-5-ureidoimidazoline decarboxylase